MMGHLEEDLDAVISKRTGALIVLPADHHTVKTYQRFATDHATDLIAKAACDQCNICTEFCPRYLLGQPVRPETAMRNRMFTREEQTMVFPGNISCCECNLCTMYACPEGLDPAGATRIEKRLSIKQGLTWDSGENKAHPMNEYRKVSTKKLMQKLDVLRYRDEGPLEDRRIKASVVRIPLDQHIGAPATAVVSVGSKVEKYDLIASANGKVSSNVHASICGTVKKITNSEILIQTDE
jgi:Na+-translocating ferredoxin:NAD+ oxidoreductase RnfC subunit